MRTSGTRLRGEGGQLSTETSKSAREARTCAPQEREELYALSLRSILQHELGVEDRRRVFERFDVRAMRREGILPRTLQLVVRVSFERKEAESGSRTTSTTTLEDFVPTLREPFLLLGASLDVHSPATCPFRLGAKPHVARGLREIE